MSNMSFLFYRRPTSPAWTIAGTGAEFVSDIRLDDGNPGVLTTFHWLSAGSPATTDYVALRADWATPIIPRGAALQGLTLEVGDWPVGTKFEVHGKRVGDSGYPYALGGNALTALSVEMENGSIAVAWLFDEDLDPIVGWEIRAFNDVDGETWADADTYGQIGEADVFEGVSVDIAIGWRTQRELTSVEARTLGAQLHEVDRVPYRALEFALVPTHGDQVRREGLPTGEDWERIEAMLSRGGSRAMVYVRAKDPEGTVDYDELHRTLFFGKAKPQAIVHVARDYYSGGWRIEQVPPIV